jgi:hypothetical protein
VLHVVARGRALTLKGDALEVQTGPENAAGKLARRPNGYRRMAIRCGERTLAVFL